MDTKAAEYNCPVEVTIAVVGGKWKCLILWWLRRDARRFSELRLLIPRISQKVLSQQLRELEQQGLVGRESYPESPPRVEYALTPHGQTFSPIAELMGNWGKTHMPDYHFNCSRLAGVQVWVVSPEAVDLCASLEPFGTLAIAIPTVAALIQQLSLAQPDPLQLDSHWPDMILVDLALVTDAIAPDLMARVKSLQSRRKNTPAQDGPIRMATILPLDNSEQRGRAAQLGFAVHLPHPVDVIEMVSTIASLVAEPRLTHR